MRALIDLKSHVISTPLITQVEKVPPPGDRTPINGKYVLPVVPGVEFPIDKTSYILNGAGEVDGGDVSSQSYAHLLAMFPTFGNIYHNPLLTSNHVGEIDPAAMFLYPPTFPIAVPSRFQTGRAPGFLPDGQMPTHTAVLPLNPASVPLHPGVLITKEVDIGPYTLDPNQNPVGTDLFMVYWKLLGFTVTDDIAADFGPMAGHNDPSIRYVEEVDQEPDGFSAYISPDNGAHWCPAGLLEPVAFSLLTTKIRVAFINTSANKFWLATYAVMF